MFEATDDEADTPIACANCVLDTIPDLAKEVVDMPKVDVLNVHISLGGALNQLLHARRMSEVASSILSVHTNLNVFALPFILLLELF